MSAHRGSAWPVGYRRPKTSSTWLVQALWLAVPAAVALAMASSGFVAQGAAVALAGLLSVVWIEYAERCEDRTQVWVAFGVIMFLMALWAARLRHQRNQE